MSDLAPPALSHRIGRRCKTILRWLTGHITKPPLLIPLAVLLALWLGFQQNAGLYRRGAVPSQFYDVTLIIVLILPPAVGHVTAWLSGHRSGFWWLIWVPTLAIYWLRPWHTGTGWALFWAEHLEGWKYFKDILRLQEQAPLHTFIRLSGILAMVLVTFMVAARSWFRFIAWMREVGRDAGKDNSKSGAGAGKAEGLPHATWASAADVRDTFSHKGGIVLGEHTDPLKQDRGFDPGRPRSWNGQGKGRLITMDPARGNGHVVVLAASAGYKTAGIVIPNILNYNGPLVVVDPKGDLYARTREARESKGFKPRVIDARHGFDPFKLIAPLAPEAPSVYLTMARTLMPLGERASDISEYFHDMSTTLFAALMGHFIAENCNNVAAEISAFINRKREDVIENAIEIAGNYNFPFISDELQGLAALDERTFPGVVKGISNKLAFTRFPDVAAYGQSDDSPDEHLAALEPGSDIFINFPGQAAEDFSSFSRLLIGAIYVTCELTEQPDRPRARRLFLIDEARVLGGMSALNTIRDAGRSIGLHLMLIYQNYGQLNKAWGGEAGAAAWLDSCEARVISAVGSSRTATEIVNMLGRRTLRTRVQGSSASNPIMTPMGGTVSSSEQEQIREVPLMSAATLGQLPDHGTLIFTRRSKPILATKAIYFTREEMASRVKSPDAVTKELDATRRRSAIMTRIRDREMQNIPNPQPTLDRSAVQDSNDETGPDGSESAPTTPRKDAPDQPDNGALPAPDYTSEETDPSASPDYLARTRGRIAADRAKKAEQQEKMDETPEAEAPAQDASLEPAPDQSGVDHTDHEESGDDQNLGSDPVEPRDPPHWMSDPDGLSEPDRKIATMILGMLEGRADVHAAVSRALPAAPSGDGTHNEPAQPAAPATSEADFDPDAPIAPEDDEPSADAPTGPADAPAPDPEEASPEEIEGDTSGDEIAALADMLWTEPSDNPATSAGDAEGTEVGENDAAAANATEDADNMDGGDRSEDEPNGPSPTDGQTATKDPASPADETSPEDIEGDTFGKKIAALADMLWADQRETPVIGTEDADGASNAESDATEMNATQDADNMDGGDRSEDEPNDPSPTVGQTATKDPASPADETSPEENEGDTFGNEIAALADMLWADQRETPVIGTEDADGASNAESDATEMNATEDADNMDGGDRDEVEPSDPSPTVGQTATKDPASPAEKTSTEESEGDTSGDEIEALADMLWAGQPETPATGAEDAEGASNAESDAREMNASEDADNMDGGDRSEEEPNDRSTTDGQTATKDPASPAEKTSPEENEGDTSGEEIEALADMLWAGQVETPAVGAEESKVAEVAENEPTVTNATEDPDHVEGGDRDEAAPNNPSPTDGQTAAKDPASPAEETSPGENEGDTSSDDIEALADMLWAGQPETPATGAENAEQPPEPVGTNKGTGKAASAKAMAPRKQARKPDPAAQRKHALNANEIREAFEPRLEEFFIDRFGEPAQRRTANWRPRDRDAFSVLMNTTERGKFFDFATGKGGGLFDLIAIELCNLPQADADFPRVLQAAADYIGFSPTAITPEARKIREQQKEERARKALAEERRNEMENIQLVQALSRHAKPVTGSPAQDYLVSRRITKWPTTALAFLPSLELPESLRSRIYYPEQFALVVWATDKNGTTTGGQRILIGRDLSKSAPDVRKRKPCFGAISGSVARFPASSPAEGAPLIIAEGPESALSIWQATGHEVWAVFGVSGWARAPIPLDRPIILAPDRDAPDSPAGIAFRKAVAHQLARGCDLRIAPAPEPVGSKRDLNDTLMRADGGPDAVCAAINAAHPAGPDDLPDDETERDEDEHTDETDPEGPT